MLTDRQETWSDPWVRAIAVRRASPSAASQAPRVKIIITKKAFGWVAAEYSVIIRTVVNRMAASKVSSVIKRWVRWSVKRKRLVITRRLMGASSGRVILLWC